MRSVKVFLVAVAAVMAGQPVQAAEPFYGGPFSADIVMQNPKNPAEKAQGKLFVGDMVVRAEGTHNNQSKAVLMDYRKHQLWTLDITGKTFHQGPGDAPMPPGPDVEGIPSDADSPCNKQQQGQQMTCKAMGQEQVGGVNAEKWEMTSSQQGQQMRMLLWFDPQRRIVVRSESQNGPSMLRTFQGQEQVNGRCAEKWEIANSYQGKSQKVMRWVDCKLRVPVKVVGEGQFTAELTNIQEGAQAPQLFTIPTDFKQVQPPQPKQQGGGQGGQGGQPQQGGGYR